MNMSPNQKEILISKLKTEKKEYEHYKDDLKDFKFQILTLQEKIMKLNKEKVCF